MPKRRPEPPPESQPDPTPGNAARGGRRRATLEKQRADWQAQLDDMRERGGHDREIMSCMQKVHDAEHALHAFDVATVLAVEPDAERRAGVHVREAIASRSHVAAGAAERQLQDLRATRLAREQAEAEARAQQQSPDAALASLIDVLLEQPDHVRRQVAERLGGSVHVVSTG